MSTDTDARLYAAVIAIASGTYSIASSAGDGMGAMPMSDSVMLLVGVVVILHGFVLLTPLADRIGAVSGPLMIVWAAIMLANQLLAATSDSMASGWDGGMVTLAVLMLVSGALMTRHRAPR